MPELLAGAPWLAELLNPTAIRDASRPLFALPHLFPWHREGEPNLASTLTHILRSPGLSATVATLIALEMIRRHARAARQSSTVTQLPEITGPRGL
jgi:hypothetical protein